MSIHIKLTPDQEKVFAQVKSFFNDEENPAIVIMGSAGTGKTTLTKYIADHIIDNHIGCIAAIAPTHKARRVLEKTLNLDRFGNIPSFTIASILGKIREHTYIGSHKYTNGSKQKMDRFDCFILDEVSMVEDKDLEEIIDYICTYDKKIILVGDNCQIPAPSQKLIRNENICFKPDSLAFDIVNLYELKDIIRQSEGSIIIKIATYLRDNLLDESTIKDILNSVKVNSDKILISYKNAYKEFNKDFNKKLVTRIIAYTNSAVCSHNKKVRKDLGISNKIIVENELITGYNNVGWPVPVIENGTDYRVLSIQDTNKHIIHGYAGLTGKFIDITDIMDPTNISRNLFLIDVKHSSNAIFMKEFVKRAEKVNKRYSTKNAYRKYCQLKNKAIFIENVYKYAGKIMTESDLKQNQPLLFTKVNEVINIKRKTISISELSKKLEDRYGQIIEGRLIDNKPFGDGEVFADQYMVVEKDIYYGYALTAHKCQASTYDSVYVDENDFNKISNKWNFKLRAIEQRCKEKNQLKYVAYTRASKKLKIMI